LDVLLLAARVSEAKVDELDFFVFERLQYIGGCSHAFLLLMRKGEPKKGRKRGVKGTFFAEREKQKLCHKLALLARGRRRF
jgi:hypothetical protein